MVYPLVVLLVRGPDTSLLHPWLSQESLPNFSGKSSLNVPDILKSGLNSKAESSFGFLLETNS